MNLIKILLFGLVIVLAGCILSACAGPPVIQYKTTLVIIPDSYLLDCDVAAPPSVETYLSSDWEKREELLTDLNNKQTLGLRLCNDRLSKIRAWKQEQQKLFPTSSGAQVK